METSNADQNGHETLVKVGRIAPCTSAGLVLSGLTIRTSLLTSTIHNPKSTYFPIAANLVFHHTNGPATSRCNTAFQQNDKHSGIRRRPEKIRKPVGIRIDFGDKGDTATWAGVCVTVGGR